MEGLRTYLYNPIVLSVIPAECIQSILTMIIAGKSLIYRKDDGHIFEFNNVDGITVSSSNCGTWAYNHLDLVDNRNSTENRTESDGSEDSGDSDDSEDSRFSDDSVTEERDAPKAQEKPILVMESPDSSAADAHNALTPVQPAQPPSIQMNSDVRAIAARERAKLKEPKQPKASILRGGACEARVQVDEQPKSHIIGSDNEGRPLRPYPSKTIREVGNRKSTEAEIGSDKSETLDMDDTIYNEDDTSDVADQMSEDVIVSKEMDSVNFSMLMNDIDTFIIDDGGVLCRDESVIPGSPQFIEFLVKNNKKVIILLSDIAKSRATYAKELEKLGYSNIDKNWLVNPLAVVADNLSRAGFGKGMKSVYLIGSKGIKEEMDEFGIEYFGDGPETSLDTSDGSSFVLELELPKPKKKVGAVVVGYTENFNYKKLMMVASNYLTNPDCHCFLVVGFRSEIIVELKRLSGKLPSLVYKTSPLTFEYIQRKWNIDPERTIMVGDRTNTDVKFGRDHGLKTLLVLSGCHQVEDILQNQKNSRFDMVPDFYAKCLGDLLPKKDENANKIL